MTTLKILTATRVLIAEPARWTKGAYARNRNGDEIEHDRPGAVCWCLVGALKKAGHFTWDLEIPADVTACLRKVGVRSQTIWNDAKRRTHAQVVAMLDRAIANAGVQR